MVIYSESERVIIYACDRCQTKHAQLRPGIPERRLDLIEPPDGGIPQA